MIQPSARNPHGHRTGGFGYQDGLPCRPARPSATRRLRPGSYERTAPLPPRGRRLLGARRFILLCVALSGAALIAPAASSAQVRPASTVAAEGAQRALAGAAEEASRQGWAVSVAVVDPAGELVAFLRMDGAPYSSVDIARGKARTAARFRRPTRGLDSLVVAGRLPILSFEGVTPVEGGVPIVVGGEVVGAVGVSGVTSAQDAQVARAGARAVRP